MQKIFYSIIIPIHNEIQNLQSLLNGLKPYEREGHQVLIVDDGSNDGSNDILKRIEFIELLSLEKNYGKGIAIREGLLNSLNDKIVIFDGDMELNPKQIKKLMVLNHPNGINCIIGSRFKTKSLLSLWNFGNFLLTVIFNTTNKSNYTDALCCAKSFYKRDIDITKLKSKSFDIDVELLTILNDKYPKNKIIHLNYSRRTSAQGKKLNILDGWSILKRILIK